MAFDAMDRKKFVRTLGGACMCAAASGMRAALAEEPPAGAAAPAPAEGTPARAAKRMEFVDGWVGRFFGVVDETLDEPTRRRLMVASGRACFRAFDKEGRRRPEPASLETIAAWVARNGKERGYSMQGNVITFEYLGSAETGQASPENVCLCPLVEGQKARTMSPTYCQCSVGYVQEMHERIFGRPVEVKVTDSVLLGGRRCRFTVTV